MKISAKVKNGHFEIIAETYHPFFLAKIPHANFKLPYLDSRKARKKIMSNREGGILYTQSTIYSQPAIHTQPTIHTQPAMHSQHAMHTQPAITYPTHNAYLTPIAGFNEKNLSV